MAADARSWRSALAWGVLAVLCLAGLGRGLWTPDEPREAGMSREMYLDPGMIPTLNGEPFYEKPPLYYLTVAGVFAATGGPSVAGARAVSGLAALLTLAVVFAWGARARSAATGWVAVFLLGTSAEFLVAAHWVRIDALLMLFCSVAAWMAWEILERGGHWFRLGLFYGALALALWTKGLIGPVLIAAGLAAYGTIRRSIRALLPLRPFVGIGFGLAAFGVLAWAIYLDGGREALWQWGYVNHVERFVDPQQTGHRQGIHYYLLALPAAVLPWLFPLLDLFRSRARFWAKDAAAVSLKTFCGAMVLGGLAVLTLSSTKRQVYLLPVLPPLFVLMAVSLAERFDEVRREGVRGGWLRAAVWLQGALCILLALAVPAAHAAYTGGFGIATAALAAAGLAVTWRLIRAVLWGDAPRTARRAAEVVLVAWLGILVLAAPALEAQKDMAPFVAEIGSVLPAGETVYAGGADETLLGIVPFVTGRKVVDVHPEDLAEVDESSEPPPSFVVLQSRDRDPVWPEIERRYEPVVTRTFGAGRRISLWRLKAR